MSNVMPQAAECVFWPAKSIYGSCAALFFSAWPASGSGAVFSKAGNRRQVSAVVSVVALACTAREFIAQNRRRFSAVKICEAASSMWRNALPARNECSCFPLCLQAGILAQSTQWRPGA
jgi:hypothetical protein